MHTDSSAKFKCALQQAAHQSPINKVKKTLAETLKKQFTSFTIIPSDHLE
jgi:hypothetical protein